MKIVLASNNAKKKTELQILLGEYIPNIEILSLQDIGFTDEIEENGITFEENALIKASVVSRFSGLIAIGDDSGLSVNALGGAPGVYSARYAGIHGDDEANNQKLLQQLQNVNDRSASFICCMACVFPNGKKIVTHGEIAGDILHEYRGQNGFGYDPLFFYPPFGVSTAEMTLEQKNEVSHRGKAVRELCRLLKEQPEFQ